MKCKLKFTLSFHVTQARMTSIKKTNDSKHWRKCRKRGTFAYPLVVGVWTLAIFMQISVKFLNELKETLLYTDIPDEVSTLKKVSLQS